MRSDVIALLAIVFAATAVILAALFLRNRSQRMLHEERMAALEKGAAIPLGYSWSPRVYLLRGLIWSFSGAALLLCLVALAATSHRPATAEALMYRASDLARVAGIPLDRAREIVEQDRGSREEGAPAGIALLGLIPLAVGLAYLVYYRGESRIRSVAESNGGSELEPGRQRHLP